MRSNRREVAPRTRLLRGGENAVDIEIGGIPVVHTYEFLAVEPDFARARER